MMSSLTNQRSSGMRRRPSAVRARRPSESIPAAFLGGSRSSVTPRAVRSPRKTFSSFASFSDNTSLPPRSGELPLKTSCCAGPLPLPSEAGPSLLRSRGWLRFPEAVAAAVRQPVLWWGQNWRKGGLQERRNEVIREQGFYNQTWCGCEFSRNQNPLIQ